MKAEQQAKGLIAEAQLRPFASGAAWFTDSFEYTSGGKVREASERRSCEFSIGVTAGQ